MCPYPPDNHIDNFHLLDQYQSGFRRGHSTQSANTHIVADVLQMLDHNESCLLILLNFSSAFEMAKHDSLLDLLECKMSLSGPVLDWFASFLHNRTQRIKINHSLSNPTPVTLGVPQCSTQSPTLFNLFMEQLTEILKSSNLNYHMYVGDTQLYLKISPEDIRSLNAALQKAQNWLTSNHLKLNNLKTEYLLIAPPKHSLDIAGWLKHPTALNCIPHCIY